MSRIPAQTYVRNKRERYFIHGLIDSQISDRVYDVTDRKGGLVAIKAERRHDHGNTLLHEYQIYKYLEKRNFQHIPRPISNFTYKENNYLVMEELSGNVSTRLSQNGGPFDMETVLTVAISGVKMLKSLHQLGVAHGMISPKCLLTGQREKREKFFLVGFRNAININIDPIPDRMPPITNPMFAPTATYEAGYATLKGDVEALMYSMVYMAKYNLPWEDYVDLHRCYSVPTTSDPLYKIKKKTTPAQLCSGLPDCIQSAYDYVRWLAPFDTPDYEKIYQPFEDLLDSVYPDEDFRLDWN